jgi:hypothetical protein
MNIQLLSASLIALTLIIPTVAQQAIASSFKDRSYRCYFFKGETLTIEDICKSDGGSWAGGGGQSLKWSDGIITSIQFGLQGRGTPACPSTDQISVDGTCEELYYRSTKTLKRLNKPTGNVMECVQLDKKSVCWKFQDP